MKPNLDKLDGAALALLYLTGFTGSRGELAFTRARKRHDGDVRDGNNNSCGK